MGILGTALGRMVHGTGQLANKYIDESLAQQRAQALADIQQAMQVKSDQYLNSPERREAMRNQAGLDASATAAGALQADIARASSTPLQDATITATNRVAEGTLGPKVAAEAAITRAKSDNTAYSQNPGDQRRIGPDLIAENTRPTGAEVTRDAYAAGQKGGTGKVDHFTDKEWNDARKIEPALVTFPDDMGGKPVESPELRQVFRTQLTAMQSTGRYSPQDAADRARETTLLLKNKAMEMVAAARTADKKSTLTETQAVQQILKRYEAAAGQRKPAAAPSRASDAPASPASPPSPAAKPLMERARESAAAPPDAVRGMSVEALKRVAAIKGHANQQQAIAELERRKAEQPEIDGTGQGFGVYP